MDTPVDPKTVRIYHVTHVDNLASILGEGAVLADGAGAAPVVDMSAPDARVFRRAAEVDGADAVVADYVPFLLSTDAHVWNAVRTGTPDPRLAPAAVERQPADHVILVSSVAGAVGPLTDTDGTVVVTDADAAAGGVAAASAWPDVLRMLQRLHREEDGGRLLSAEFLVRECLPARARAAHRGGQRPRARPRACGPRRGGAQDARGGVPAVVPADGAARGGVATDASAVAASAPTASTASSEAFASNGAAAASGTGVGRLLEQRSLRLLDPVEVGEPVGAVMAVDPVPVQQEPERGAERQADDVRGDVVGEDAGVAQPVVADPEARERDQHAADRDRHVLHELAHVVAPAMVAEGPVPVAEPVEDDRHARRDRLGADRRLRPVVLAEDAEPQEVEERHVDDEADQPDDAELDGVREQAVPEAREGTAESGGHRHILCLSASA